SEQDAFVTSLAQRGVRALPRETYARQIDGSTRHIQYRFTYLLNGFVAYVADADIERLKKMPEVAHVSVAESPVFHLDKAIDYSLGTQTNPQDRRTAVYGPTQEFDPQPGVVGHPEAPRTTQIDGFEGQKMRIAVIDSGVDWRHPMFGGIGQGTPTPRVSGQPENPADNRKVIYYYALSSPGDPTDDFGHGTLVASCAAGYSVDGNTPPRLGYGLGRDGTGVGPTIDGAQLFGTAPQSQILAYKVCGPAPQCPGDIPLSIEVAASPFTLVSSGNAGPTPVRKPVADVINLSLGSTNGDPASATSRATNNASLAGSIVVTSAGNSGPGASTVGAPGAATLPLTVGASLDPGSISASDVLAPDQIPGETRTPGTPGPAPEKGAASNANVAQPGERQGIKIFPVAGGGPIPEGSLSAHYVFVDRRATPPAPVPPSVGNRIAVVKGSGTFASIANPVAANVPPPAAIIIVTTVEAATAVVVVNGIPTFTMNPADADYLLGLMGQGAEPPNGAISTLPLRLADSFSLESYQPSMAGFSSRGPLNHPNARFRVIKPDVTAPGVGIVGAATVEGLPDETIGLASLSGYTKANGTSFSSPIAAGAIALVRQYVRETLGLDLTDSLADQANPNWRAVRFDAVTISKALLMNSSTNLRSGLGVPQGDGPASIASINDMGAGHINVAGALQGKAIMVAPTDLLRTPAEFTPQPPPSPAPSPAPSPTPLPVLIPSVSFGEVPVVNVNGIITRSREVVIRDVGNGAGAGVYNLSVQNNRGLENSGFQVSFAQMDGTPTNSVIVPAGGQVTFRAIVQANGNQIGIDGSQFMWYVTASSPNGQNLRMPFYYRAVAATVPNITAPVQTAPTGVENPGNPCPVDTNGSYNVNWTYTPPAAGGASPIGFRIQEATRSQSIYFDDASQPLVGGANSRWTGSAQWSSAVNPDTGRLAYYIPDTANQNESLTMATPLQIPPGGATLSYLTREDTEEGFDFTRVEISTDGVSFVTLGSFSGLFSGTRALDISAYAGLSVRIRFRMTSDLVVSAPGWWVQDIRVSSDDFTTIANTDSSANTLAISGRPAGTYNYRVAALFTNPIDPGTTVTGPYSNVRCVTVAEGPAPSLVDSRKTHGSAGTFDIPLPLAGNPGVECRVGAVQGEHQVVFTFPSAVTVEGAAVSSGQGTVTSFSPSGTTIVVNLAGVADVQTIVVTLTGVNGTGNVSAPIAMLIGDTTANRVVNSTDVSQTKTRSGETANGTNFRSDVFANGAINGNDIGLIKSRSGNQLP
ncbi:MAG: S8 family serine peptidase, partial [Chthoniobacterales bacterium]|nr:S8 family serine peptidase [Chthoniobacterales bacterium]